MSGTLELIKELHDRRGGLISQQRELHAQMEARGEDGPTEEDNAKWEALDKDIRSLGDRINGLTTVYKNAVEAEKQREEFASLLVSPDEERKTETDTLERITAFMRAAVTDTYAPSSITLSFRDASVRKQKERRDLTKGAAPDAGATVPTSFSDRFFEHLVEFNAVRQTNATVLTTSSGESLQIPATATYGSAAIVAEAGTIAEADPTFKQVTLGAFKYGKFIEITRELLEDTAIDLPGFLAREAGRAIGLANGAHLVTGTGTGQPQGITNAATQVGTAGALTADRLFDLYHSVVTGYRTDSFWIMNDTTAATIRKFKDTTNQYLWQPGLVAGQPDRLLGRPVVTDPSMPTSGVNASIVGFGDFSAYYVIRDVDGVRFERSDDFRFQNDLIAYRALFRTDAKQLINGASGAVKFLATAA